MFAEHINNNKYRYEYKYIVSTAQMEILKTKLNSLLHMDSHTNDRQYVVRSLYFDNYNNKCFYENENSINPREKFRLRIYNQSDKFINFEIKIKENGKCLKFRTPVTIEQAHELIEGKTKSRWNNELLDYFNSKVMTEIFKPKIIVEYTRTPYVYDLGQVRITFDTNISSSKQVDGFFDTNISKRPVMPLGMNIMEVKYKDFLPDFIFNALQIDNLNLVTFSKYYLCRRYSL